MIASIQAATLLGTEGRPVVVEVHVALGLPGFTVVGQPDGPCREARDRVRAALLSSGLVWPARKITVNLAPAGMRKVGASLDLAIAIGVLVANGDLPAACTKGMAFLGELGLDGTVRRLSGTVPLAASVDADELVVPATCAAEANLLQSLKVRPVTHLREVVAALQVLEPWPDPYVPVASGVVDTPPEFAEVHGQPMARQALEIAAAGGHHLLMSGPPGSGKTMLATRLPGLLPSLDVTEALEVLQIHSAAGLPFRTDSLPTTPPFRSPHHTASAVALLGGGTASMRPGEVSCAHRGVLFLDEMGEFSPFVLDSLRQPLEEGVIRVDRAKASITLSSRFLLVGATNPCPCGWAGNPSVGDDHGFRRPQCRCSEAARARYSRRLSGPLLDRFDLRVEVDRPEPDELLAGKPEESTQVVAARVWSARTLAKQRGVRCNAELSPNQLDAVAPLSVEARRLIEGHLRRGSLTARGLTRIRRVARTIADLQDAGDALEINEEQICTALEFRRPLRIEAVA